MALDISQHNLSRRTKIVCTIGPSSRSPKTMQELLLAGMDVARINFSHGTSQEHVTNIKNLRKVAKKLSLPLAIMQDLPGPKNRTGKLADGLVELKENTNFIITTRDVLGDGHQVSVDLPELPKKVQAGDTIFLDDGAMKLKVMSISGTDINCQVIVGGKLGEEKGVNIPGIDWGATAITDKDLEHLEFGIKHKVDFVALSYITSAQDVLKIKKYLQQKATSTSLITKIERREALENLDGILEVADGVMVARGDLGIEIPIQRVPIVQKKIIQKCNHLGKPVIVATQMLESMVNAPAPTRPEATDIANAIFDGADALMLSEETAVGNYPKEAVSMMSLIILETEPALPYKEMLANKGKDLQPQTDDAISYAACHTAQQLGAVAIVAFTSSGSTARRVAKYRPEVPILAITSNEVTQRQLSLSWGIHTFLVTDASRVMDLFAQGAKVAKGTGLANDGDLVVITGGVPVGISGSTNLLKVERI